MKRLILIVEGQTELEFVNRLLTPYLVARGVNTSIQPIMITMKGGAHGFNNIEHLGNTIRPLLNDSDEPIITTIIDHYGINSETKLPGYTECSKEQDMSVRLDKMETKLNEYVQRIKPYRHFIPYIQRHEMETLLFSDPENGFVYEDIRIKNEVLNLCKQFNSIEDINDTPEGAPSKRLADIYSKYQKKYVKIVDGIEIAELTTIGKMLEMSPRFKRWVEQLIEVMEGKDLQGVFLIEK